MSGMTLQARMLLLVAALVLFAVTATAIPLSGSETDPYVDLWDLMDASGVDVLLVGHNHIYQRWAPQDGDGVRDPNGVTQFTVGTGGRSLYPFGPKPGPRTSSRPRTKRSECCR